MQNIPHFGGNFTPVVFTDSKEHTPEKPICWNPTCSYKEDQTAIQEVHRFVRHGLLTPTEATEGKML